MKHPLCLTSCPVYRTRVGQTWLRGLCCICDSFGMFRLVKNDYFGLLWPYTHYKKEIIITCCILSHAVPGTSPKLIVCKQLSHLGTGPFNWHIIYQVEASGPISSRVSLFIKEKHQMWWHDFYHPFSCSIWSNILDFFFWKIFRPFFPRRVTFWP